MVVYVGTGNFLINGNGNNLDIGTDVASNTIHIGNNNTATAVHIEAGTGDVLAGIIGALVATNYITILNDPEQLAKVAATGALIHNLAAVAASKHAPICATSIIEFIPEVIRKIIK